MKVSLRAILLGMWLLIVIVCIALGVLMAGVFQLGVGAEVRSVHSEVVEAGRATRMRFTTYLGTYSASPAHFDDPQRQHDLELILQAALADYPGVEGGFWDASKGFIAYAYPSYGGGAPKKDVPAAETGHITQVASEALVLGRAHDRHFDNERESLIIFAEPAGAGQLAIWTMSRAHVAAGKAYQKLAAGFAALFIAVLASGLCIMWFLQRWLRQIASLETSIASASSEEPLRLSETGQKELDRIVGAMNFLSARLRQSRHEAQELSSRLAKTAQMVMLGRMAAEVTHDIRNPIAAMRLRAENALAKSPEGYAEALRLVLQEINRLDDLLERLLSITRLENPIFAPVQLSVWLTQRLDALRPRADHQGATLEGRAPEAKWMFDERSLTRALDNLILNAIQHTPAGGWVKVAIEVQGSECRIIVEDSGPGIPDAETKNMFEPLVSTRAEGFGLGLGIARQIVEAHGGALRYAKGSHGARFEVELPWPKS
jgi:signal transduction histidine kinase